MTSTKFSFRRIFIFFLERRGKWIKNKGVILGMKKEKTEGVLFIGFSFFHRVFPFLSFCKM